MDDEIFLVEVDVHFFSLYIIAESFNPCPALKHIVYSCAETVRHCFDHRGWERGRQVSAMMIRIDLSYTKFYNRIE